MGIKGLLKLLKLIAPNSITDKDITDYEQYTVAIDALNIIIRHVMAILSHGNNKYSHIMAIWYKTLSFLYHGNLPIYVFDGVSPNLKQNTLMERRRSKQKAINRLNNLDEGESNDNERTKLIKKSYVLNKNSIDEIKHILSLLGLPFIQAPHEADTVCTALNVRGDVYGVVTEDMDILPFGAPIMLRDYSNKKVIKEINLKQALVELELTHSQFIDICILLGTDYCPSIRGLKPLQIYEKYKATGDMESFISYLESHRDELNWHYNIPANFLTKWQQTKDYYQNHRAYDGEITTKLEWTKPNKKELYQLLCGTYGFNEDMTRIHINTIQHIYISYQKTGKIVGKHHRHHKRNHSRSRGRRYNRTNRYKYNYNYNKKNGRPRSKKNGKPRSRRSGLACSAEDRNPERHTRHPQWLRGNAKYFADQDESTLQ